MLFSIIIPVYNVEPYLEECINSVLCQTYEMFELILVDDGSTDRSGKICDAFARQDSRIQVVHQENRGLSGARNAGIRQATGEYLMFLDSDDYWYDENILAALAHRLKKTNPDVLCFNYVKFSSEGFDNPYFSASTLPVDNNGVFFGPIQRDLWIACAWNKVIRHVLFQNSCLNFVEGITSEDMDWCIRLALAAEKFDYLDTVVVCYRQRESSISARTSPAKVQTVLRNIRRCLELLEDNGTDRAEQLKPFVAYQYGTALYHMAKLPESREKDDLLTQAKELRYLLRWSNNRKIRLLNLSASLGGLKFSLILLRWK